MEICDDIDVVRRVMGGEIDAYELLVKKYQGAVFSFLLRFTGSQSSAQELAQETFMKAYANLGRFDTSRRFFPWIYTIAVNLAKDWGRKYAVHLRVMETSNEKLPETSVENQQDAALELKEDLARLEKALARITTENREALILRYRYDLSFKEIARVFDISLSAAKMRVHRGMEQVKQVMNGKNG